MSNRYRETTWVDGRLIVGDSQLDREYSAGRESKKGAIVASGAGR